MSQNKTLTRMSAGFQRFKKQWFCQEHNLYADLVEGQTPMAMVIACSDSRVDPVLATDSHQGDLFVVRNVANLVPPYTPDEGYHGVSAAVEFAVRHLKVNTIIVMGHSQCGGIGHLLADDKTKDTEFLGIWMNVAQRAKNFVELTMPDADHATRQTACEQWSIRVSLDNLLTFPWVRKAVEAGELTLRGWYFDIVDGELYQLEEDSDQFLPLSPGSTNNPEQN